MRVNFKNEANHRPLQETYEAEEAKSFIQKVKNMGFDVFFFFCTLAVMNHAHESKYTCAILTQCGAFPPGSSLFFALLS